MVIVACLRNYHFFSRAREIPSPSAFLSFIERFDTFARNEIQKIRKWGITRRHRSAVNLIDVDVRRIKSSKRLFFITYLIGFCVFGNWFGTPYRKSIFNELNRIQVEYVVEGCFDNVDEILNVRSAVWKPSQYHNAF